MLTVNTRCLFHCTIEFSCCLGDVILYVNVLATLAVRLDVFRQMIATHETLVTDRAGEALLAAVRSQVAL